jgi:hypothetical protein
MRILFLFTGIFSLFFTTSCFKRNESHVNVPCADSCMTFNVRVTTGLNSTTPLGNTAVELGWKKPAVPLGNPGRLIASGTTADDGSLSFSFKAMSNELQGGEFYVTARNGNDYFVQENDYYGIQRYDSIVTANIHIPSKATIKIVYKNFTPLTADDVFECIPGFLTYGSEGFPLEMKKADGQLSNTFFDNRVSPFTSLELTGTTAGNQYTYFTILKKKNGVRVDLRDSIYIEKGQTKTYEIEY